MTEDESKKIRVELDHENKVIRLGCWFYDLKGVLIAEATDDDKEKYYCGKYMTYPIVDDNWEVREDECIKDGIADLVIGKKGDTISLHRLQIVLDLNAEERSGEYSDILTDVEHHGITVSNRMPDDPQRELPETITLEIDRIRKMDSFTIHSDEKGYYIPRRYCHVGKDGKLYQGTEEKENENSQYRQIVYQIAEDVNGISWFFDKHNLRVRCQRARELDEPQDNDFSIPEDWHMSVKTLEDDINSEIAKRQEEYPDDHFHSKRPIL